MRTLLRKSPVAVLLLFVLIMRGAPPYNPPPLPDPDPWDLPLDPPDPFDIPFDPINDFPEPIDLPPFPEDPWDDPIADFPLPPDPFELDDPFPDVPSLLADPFDDPIDVPPPLPPGAALGDQANAAVANHVVKLMPFPMYLPLPPAITQKRPKVQPKACDPSSATTLVIPETKAGRVAIVSTCPWSVLARVSVGTTPLRAASANDGQTVLVTTLSPPAVSVLSLSTRKVIASIPLAFDSQPNNVAVLPDGSRAYVTSHEYNPSARVFVIDLTTRKVLTTLFVAGYPAGIASTPDGSQVWVTSRGDGVLSVIDTMTNSVVYTDDSFPYVTGIAFNPTGTRAYIATGDPGTGSTNGFLNVVDTATYQVLNTITVGVMPHKVKMTPTGRYVFVTNALSKSISQVSTETEKVVRTLTLPNGLKHPLGLALIQ